MSFSNEKRTPRLWAKRGGDCVRDHSELRNKNSESDLGSEAHPLNQADLSSEASHSELRNNFLQGS